MEGSVSSRFKVNFRDDFEQFFTAGPKTVRRIGRCEVVLNDPEEENSQSA